MRRNDLIRELDKILDTIEGAEKHFRAEAEMNAALHMSDTVRPAPLSVAVGLAADNLTRLLSRLSEEEVTE